MECHGISWICVCQKEYQKHVLWYPKCPTHYPKDCKHGSIISFSTLPKFVSCSKRVKLKFHSAARHTWFWFLVNQVTSNSSYIAAPGQYASPMLDCPRSSKYHPPTLNGCTSLAMLIVYTIILIKFFSIITFHSFMVFSTPLLRKPYS